MSIICHKPEGVDFPKNALEKCFNSNNPDAAGYSYAMGGVIYVKRGFKSFENLFASLLEVEKFSCLITFSNKQIPNENKFLQPFKLDKNHFVGYDGAFLSRKDLNNPLCSQGYNFTNLLKSFDTDLFKKDYFIKLLSAALSKSNSGCAAVINNLGEVFVFNKAHGTELLKCWFSSNPYCNITTINTSNTTNTVSVTGNIKQCGDCAAWYNLNSLIWGGASDPKSYCRDCTNKILVRKNSLLTEKRQREMSNPYKDHLTNLESIVNITLVNILDLF